MTDYAVAAGGTSIGYQSSCTAGIAHWNSSKFEVAVQTEASHGVSRPATDAAVQGARSSAAVLLAAVRHTSADVPFVTEVLAPATTAPKRAFHVGDFDGDGDVDVLVGVGSSAADAAVLLFSNAAVVPLTATLVSASVGLPNSVVMADVDRDSNMDVVCAAADKRVTWLRNQGAGMFGEGSVLTNSTTVVSVGVADLDLDLDMDVMVAAANESVITWLENLGAQNFRARIMATTAQMRQPRMLNIYDVDADGDLDVLSASSADGKLLLYENRRVSGFTTRTVGLVRGAAALSSADLDGDGDADVVAAGPSQIVWCSNNAKVYTQRNVTSAGNSSRSGAVAVATGDVDGDGVIDVLASSSDDAAVVLLLSSGGSAPVFTSYVVDAGATDVLSVVAVDFDDDGDLDALSLSSSVVKLHRNVARAVMQPRALPAWNVAAQGYPVVGTTVVVSVADTNGMHTGFAVAPGTVATVNDVDVSATFVEAGKGVYNVSFVVDAGALFWPWTGLRVAMTLAHRSGNVSAVSGTVIAQARWPAAASTLTSTNASRSCADIDSDGDVDCVCVQPQGLVLLVNSGSGVFSNQSVARGVPIVPASSARAVAMFDADGDGDVDVVVARSGAGAAMLVNNGAGVFASVTGRGWGGLTTVNVSSLVPLDADGDGDVDVFVTAAGGLSVLWLNNGTGTFTNASSDAMLSTRCAGDAVGAAAFDANRDGAVDVLVVTASSTPNCLYINNGGGFFVDAAAARGVNDSRMGQAARGVAVADVDSDGDVDVWLCGDAGTQVLLNNGTGFFVADTALSEVSSRCASVALADVDLDGDVDAFVSTGRVGAGRLLINVGPGVGGAAASLVDYSAATGVFGAAAESFVDVDGDGDVDAPGLGLANTRARVNVTLNVLRVRVLGRNGSPSQHGATVVVRDSATRGIVSAWVVGGGSSLAQAAYDVHVGVSDAIVRAGVDVDVVYTNRRVMSRVLVPSLGAINLTARFQAVRLAPLVVWDVPAVTAVTLVPSSGLIPAGSSITFTLVAYNNETGLVAHPASVVNGVNVTASCRDVGGGVYTFVYEVLPGSASVSRGGLRFSLALLDSDAVAAAATTTAVTHSSVDVSQLTIDTVPPAVNSTCGPTNGSVISSAVSRVCFSCGNATTEPFGCASFLYTVNGSAPVALPVTPVGGWSADADFGPFAHRTVVALVVRAVDAAGNAGPPLQLTWTLDLESPVTLWTIRPRPFVNDTTAVFGFDCSEPGCQFEYSYDGGPRIPIGGRANATSGGGSAGDAVALIDTGLTSSVAHVTNSTTAVFTLSVVNGSAVFAPRNASGNATVEVRYDEGAAWVDVRTLPGYVVVSGVGTLTLVDLARGAYMLQARAVLGPGIVDATPATLVWRVDGVAPTVSLFRAPPRVRAVPSNVAVFVLSSDEPDVRIEYTLAAPPSAGPTSPPPTAAWVALPTPVLRITGLVPGLEYSAAFRGVDAAGNVGAATTWSFSSAACVAPVVLAGLDTASLDVGLRGFLWQPTVVATGTTSVLYEWRIDGNATWSTTVEPFAVAVGVAVVSWHEFEVRVVGPLECPQHPTATLSWFELESPPGIAGFAATPPPSTSDAISAFAFNATAVSVWFEYSLDGSSFAPCDRTLRVGPLSTGTHVLSVRTVDVARARTGPAVAFVWSVAAASSSSLALPAPAGPHSLTVWAADMQGNTELSPLTYAWLVDTVAPVVNVTLASPSPTNSRNGDVALSCDDGRVGAVCKFCVWSRSGSGPVSPRNCTTAGVVRVVAAAEGVQTVFAVAADEAGNSGRVVNLTYVVDLTPPTSSLAVLTPLVFASSINANLLNASVVELNVTGSEPLVGAVARVNGVAAPVNVSGGSVPGAPQRSVRIAVAGLTDGIRSISVFAVDVAGNVASTPSIVSLRVSVAPPSTVVTRRPPAITSSTVVVFNVTGNQTFVGLLALFRLSSTPPIASLPPVVALAAGSTTAAVTVSGLSSARYTVRAWAEDVLGRADAVGASVTFAVDQVPPRSAIADFANVSSSGIVAMRVVAYDLLDVVVRVRVDGGEWATVINGTRVEFEVGDGMRVFEAYSVDAVGNVEPPPYTRVVVVVDTVPPVVRVTELPARYSRNSSVALCAAVDDVSPSSVVAWVDGVAAPLSVTRPGCYSVAVVGDGNRTLDVGAVDAVGNMARSNVSAWFVMDTVLPVVSVLPLTSVACSSVRGIVVCNSSLVVFNATCDEDDAGGSNAVSVSPCHVEWSVTAVTAVRTECGEVVGSAADAGTLVWFALDVNGSTDDTGGSSSLLTAAAGATITLRQPRPDGQYRVLVRGTDEAGNVGAVAAVSWWVDTRPPLKSPQFVSMPPRASSTQAAVFQLQLRNDTSPGQTTFWYTVESRGGVLVPMTRVPTLPVPNDAVVPLSVFDLLADAAYVVSVFAQDQAGWFSASPSQFAGQVVAAAPVVRFAAQPATESGARRPRFQLVAVWDEGSARTGRVADASFEVLLVGDPFLGRWHSPCAEPTAPASCASTCTGVGCNYTVSLVTPQTYTLQVRAKLYDLLGEPRATVWRFHRCDTDEYTVFEAASAAGVGAGAGDAPLPGNGTAPGDVDEAAGVGVDGDRVTCRPCPVGGNCTAGNGTDVVLQRDIVAQRGFWASADSDGLRFYTCPVPSACLPGINGSRSLCADGYQEVACSTCSVGYFEQFGRCSPCPKSRPVSVLALVGMSFLFIVFAGAVFKVRNFLPIADIKVGLSMVQIIAAANNAYDIPWPDTFANFLDNMRVFLIDIISLTRTNCTQRTDFYASLLVVLIGFKLVVVAVVVASWSLHKWRKKHMSARVMQRMCGVAWIRRLLRLPPSNQVAPHSSAHSSAHVGIQPLPRPLPQHIRSTSIAAPGVPVAPTTPIHRRSIFGTLTQKRMNWNQVLRMSFTVLVLAYPGVSLKILRMFRCREIEGRYWLVADMRLQCYTRRWGGYAVYAVLMMVVYVIGLPITIFMILFRRRHRLFGESSERARLKFGFLYVVYGENAWWWEVEELVRKLFLTAVVVLMDAGSPLQVVLAVLVCAWAHVLHATFKPWGVASFTYLLQHGSLGVTFFVFLMGLLFKMEGVSHGSATYDFLTAIMMLMCVAFLASWLLTIFWRVARDRLREKPKRRGVEESEPDETPSILSSPSEKSGANTVGLALSPRHFTFSRSPVGASASAMSPMAAATSPTPMAPTPAPDAQPSSPSHSLPHPQALSQRTPASSARVLLSPAAVPHIPLQVPASRPRHVTIAVGGGAALPLTLPRRRSGVDPQEAVASRAVDGDDAHPIGDDDGAAGGSAAGGGSGAGGGGGGGGGGGCDGNSECDGTPDAAVQRCFAEVISSMNGDSHVSASDGDEQELKSYAEPRSPTTLSPPSGATASPPRRRMAPLRLFDAPDSVVRARAKMPALELVDDTSARERRKLPPIPLRHVDGDDGDAEVRPAEGAGPAAASGARGTGPSVV